MQRSKTYTLAASFLSDTLTASEQEEFYKILHDSSKKEELSDAFAELSGEPDLQVPFDESLAFIVERIKLMERSPKTITRVHRIHFLRTAWFRYAAAILIILGTGAYLYNTQTTKPVPGKNIMVQDVAAPATIRATLTLANGQKIFLDTVPNGVLAIQSGTSIQKTTEGQLIYSGKTKSNQLQYNELNVPRGSQVASIVLSDGSKVYLNAESSLKYPVTFSETERKVEITGEAYFEITKNAKSKFVVVSGGMKTEVLGTSFNVNGYKDDQLTKITLIEGSIRVSSSLTSAILKPGQQAAFTKDNKVEINNNADISLALAWQKGMFVFDDMELSLILKQVSRWYNVDVEYEDGIQSRKFSGALSRRSKLTEVIKIFQENGLKCSLQNLKLKVSM